MSEETKKVEPAEEETKAVELSEKDLEQVAGGGAAVTNPQQAANKFPISR